MWPPQRLSSLLCHHGPSYAGLTVPASQHHQCGCSGLPTLVLSVSSATLSMFSPGRRLLHRRQHSSLPALPLLLLLLLCVLLAVSAGAASAPFFPSDSGVLQLTDANFSSQVKRDHESSFVLFYSPYEHRHSERTDTASRAAAAADDPAPAVSAAVRAASARRCRLSG